MELTYKLLNHPFYESWKSGKISMEQLSKYAASYREFVTVIPNYWNKILTGLEVSDFLGFDVLNEEKHHVDLWEKWAGKMPETNNYPSMQSLLEKLHDMTPSQLLGAIHSFEVQQPEVSKSKKEGLMKFYGFEDSDLEYFTAHFNEEKHISLGSFLRDNYAKKAEYEEGFRKGSEMIYQNLDNFVE